MSLRENKNFRSITPNEWIQKGQLIWIEKTEVCNIQGYVTTVEGPFICAEGWGPMFFGHPSRNNPDRDYVNLISTINGEEHRVAYGSFLYQTYYIINEEESCIDAETK